MLAWSRVLFVSGWKSFGDRMCIAINVCVSSVELVGCWKSFGDRMCMMYDVWCMKSWISLGLKELWWSNVYSHKCVKYKVLSADFILVFYPWKA